MKKWKQWQVRVRPLSGLECRDCTNQRPREEISADVCWDQEWPWETLTERGTLRSASFCDHREALYSLPPSRLVQWYWCAWLGCLGPQSWVSGSQLGVGSLLPLSNYMLSNNRKWWWCQGEYDPWWRQGACCCLAAQREPWNTHDSFDTRRQTPTVLPLASRRYIFFYRTCSRLFQQFFLHLQFVHSSWDIIRAAPRGKNQPSHICHITDYELSPPKYVRNALMPVSVHGYQNCFNVYMGTVKKGVLKYILLAGTHSIFC